MGSLCSSQYPLVEHAMERMQCRVYSPCNSLLSPSSQNPHLTIVLITKSFIMNNVSQEQVTNPTFSIKDWVSDNNIVHVNKEIGWNGQQNSNSLYSSSLLRTRPKPNKQTGKSSTRYKIRGSMRKGVQNHPK